MKKLFFILLCIAEAAGICKVNAQPLDKYLQHANISSVDAYNFTKAIDQGINLNTGALNVSVPVYVYEDNDFKIPVSIDYASTGCQPNLTSGNVGQGWVLNTGGVITREVRGVPDEYRYYEGQSPYVKYGSWPQSGYFHYYQTFPKTGLNPVFSLNDCQEKSDTFYPYVTENVYYKNNKYYETTPDIFTFRFPGYSGKFNINLQQIDVYETSCPFGELDVDLSEISPADRTGKSKIRITTGDGYIYTFGGLDTIEDTEVIDEMQGFGSNMGGQYGAFRASKRAKYTNWFLTRIEAPNGRKVQLNYSQLDTVESVTPGGFTVIAGGSPTTYSSAHNFSRIRYQSKERNLVSIDIDNKCLIEFHYTKKYSKERAFAVDERAKDPIYKATAGLRESITVPQKIQLISVRETITPAQKIIKSVRLHYAQAGGPLFPKPGETSSAGTDKTFLSNIDTYEGGQYHFDYYKQSQMELGNGTPSLDYWGFYNQSIDGAYTDYARWGHNLYSSNPEWIMPNLLFHASGSLYYVGLKDPKFEKTVMGILGKITYPTGGKTYFEYELNDASKCVSRGVSDSRHGLPAIDNYSLTTSDGSNQHVGGLRVKRIYHSAKSIPSFEREFRNPEINWPPMEEPSPNEYVTKEYEYKKPDGTSSGVVLRLPIFRMSESRRLKKSHTTNYTHTIYSFQDLCANSSNEYHIQYGRVVEKLSDGSSTEYIYSTYLDTPDIDPLEVNPSGYKSSAFEWISPTLTDDIDRFRRMMISHASDRGKILAKKYYNAQGDSLAAEYYQYDRKKNLRYTGEALHTGALSYEHRILTESYPLVKMISNQYFRQNGAIQTIRRSEAYKYNSLGQLIDTQTESTNQDLLKTCTYYLNEVYTTPGANPVYDRMRSKHIVNKPQLMLSYKKDALNTSDWLLISAEKNSFSLSGTNSVPLLSSLWQSNFATPYLCTNISTIDYRNISNYKYDNYGNMLEITDKDGTPTAYLWGYKHTYPIAEVKNITYADLINKLPSDMTTLIDASTFSRENAVKLHALCSAVPQTGVTVCTYEPMVGITSKIDPTGRTVFYIYNEFGKLEQILDDRGELVEHHKFNYKSDIEF